ncbi:MAG: hypothetical protein CSA32_03115 [Desulfobulbus propionicus]|nr:MAG: hypothetical protein CSA32_03115 [Desulfobulbus propionicus]
MAERSIIRAMEKVCNHGIDTGVFPGCSAAVSYKKGSSWKRCVYAAGKEGNVYGNSKVNEYTFFDLASLTKPLCTVLLLLHLIDEQAVCWDTPLGSIFPLKKECDKNQITLTHLLSHSSGLPAYKPFFKQSPPVFDKNKKKFIFDSIINEHLLFQPGKNNCYSDLGFMLLGFAIEKISGRSLNEFYKEKITVPLELENNLFFLPLDNNQHIEKEKKVAFTEFCSWRNKYIHKEVHDEHCWLMGGVSGHSGLFGDVNGVLFLCEYLFDIWQGESNKIFLFEKENVRKIFRKPGKNKTWYLGFDTPTKGKSSSGHYFTAKSAGHLGFTGTSFWMDPEKEVIVILLTNRVHPSRENTKIKQFRPYFHDQLMVLI